MTSSNVRLFAKRHASVAAVLRGADGQLELLLLQRVASARDRWSAHIALPGGIVQGADESALDAAIRECREEAGLDLSHAGRFELVGRLDDRLATNALAVSTFVFRERAVSGSEGAHRVRLQQTEIGCAWWVPLEALHPSAVVDSCVPAAAYLPRFLRARPWLVRALGVESVLARSVPIPWAHEAGAPIPPASGDGGGSSHPFLWGLTFGIASDLRVALGMPPLVPRFRPRPSVRFSPAYHPANWLVAALRLGFALRSLAMRSRTLSSLLRGAGPTR